MSHEQSPFQVLLEKPEQLLQATRENVTRAEQEGKEWPREWERVSRIILPQLREWLNRLQGLQLPFDRQVLHRMVFMLRLRYSITWLHIPVLFALGKVIVLGLAVTLMWLWTKRWYILVLLLLLAAIYFLPRLISSLLSLVEGGLWSVAAGHLPPSIQAVATNLISGVL